MRAFVAIDLSEQVRQTLIAFSSGLKAEQHDRLASWSRPGAIHLTLIFLGDVAEANVQRLRVSLDDVARATHPFSIVVRGTGFFPSERRPRILWAGIEEVEELKALRRDVVEGAARLGFQTDKKSFRPHITLARFRTPVGAARIVERATTDRDRVFGETMVTEFRLYRSRLTPAGAVHEVVNQFAFGVVDVTESTRGGCP